MSAKIHGATITGAELEYQGSLSIDTELMKKAGILPHEQVNIYNIDNGERLTTYAIPGKRGEICMNGAAAHKGKAGHRIIIATYAWMDDDEALSFRPKVIIAGENNCINREIEYDISEELAQYPTINKAD